MLHHCFEGFFGFVLVGWKEQKHPLFIKIVRVVLYFLFSAIGIKFFELLLFVVIVFDLAIEVEPGSLFVERSFLFLVFIRKALLLGKNLYALESSSRGKSFVCAYIFSNYILIDIFDWTTYKKWSMEISITLIKIRKMKGKSLKSAVWFRLNGKIRLFIRLSLSLGSSLCHTLDWLHQFRPNVVLELSDCLGSQVFEIKLIFDFVITLPFDYFYDSLHMLARQLSDVDAQLFLFGQRDGIVKRVRSFRFFFSDLGSWAGLDDGFGNFCSLREKVGCFLVEVGFGNDFEIILLKLLSNSCEVRIALVEGVTITNDFVDVSVELSRCCVLASF